MRPRHIHFVYFLSDDRSRAEFLFSQWAAIKSAAKLNPDHEVHLWCGFLPEGNPYIEDLRSHVHFHVVAPPTEAFGRKLIHHAHRTDWLRLAVLHEHGGIYLDMDTLSVKPFSVLEDVDFGMAEQWARGECDGLGNSVIVSRKGARFAELWMNEFRHFRSRGRDEHYDEHAVKVPYRLAREHPELIHVFATHLFLIPDWTNDGLRQMFGEVRDFPDAVVHHLWEAVSREFTSQINERNYDGLKMTYTSLLKRILGEEIEAFREKRLAPVFAYLDRLR